MDVHPSLDVFVLSLVSASCSPSCGSLVVFMSLRWLPHPPVAARTRAVNDMNARSDAKQRRATAMSKTMKSAHESSHRAGFNGRRLARDLLLPVHMHILREYLRAYHPYTYTPVDSRSRALPLVGSSTVFSLFSCLGALNKRRLTKL